MRKGTLQGRSKPCANRGSAAYLRRCFRQARCRVFPGPVVSRRDIRWRWQRHGVVTPSPAWAERAIYNALARS